MCERCRLVYCYALPFAINSFHLIMLTFNLVQYMKIADVRLVPTWKVFKAERQAPQKWDIVTL